VQELVHLAKENLKIVKAIETRKPVYSARQMEHEYLENVSRIDRLSSFRGPASARHRPAAVSASLEVAKSMRSTKWLPGTDGYNRDLAKSMNRSRTARWGLGCRCRCHCRCRCCSMHVTHLHRRLSCGACRQSPASWPALMRWRQSADVVVPPMMMS
jgi:hypothetical protein